MNALTVRAAAKINLRLGVGAVRDDGFHRLDTVYQAISLYDDVTVTDARQWSLRVRASDGRDVSEVPLDERNIALKAALALHAHHRLGPDHAAAVHIEKGIPVAGGLAGGSADAAATLVALDRLWDLQTPDEDLLALAGRLGSDVPFALIGGTAAGGGRGELVQPVTDAGGWWWVVVESGQGLSTPAVYAEFDRLHGEDVGPLDEAPTTELLAALRSGDPRWLARAVGNDLELPACTLRPDLERTRTDGLEAGAVTALLSGSGPTWLFLCTDSLHAQAVRLGLIDRGHTRVTAATGPVAGAHRVSYE